jgi:hypothetical protein
MYGLAWNGTVVCGARSGPPSTAEFVQNGAATVFWILGSGSWIDWLPVPVSDAAATRQLQIAEEWGKDVIGCFSFFLFCFVFFFY